MSWFVWRSAHRDGFCDLGALENVPRDEEILRGQPRAGDFPKDALYRMREDGKDTKVADNAYAMIHHVVSAKLRALVEPALEKSRVEFLPVRIRDRAGRFVDGEHYVMNPVDVVDAIDAEASVGEYNDLDPTQLCLCEELVLRPIPDGVVMFRPHNWLRLIFVRDDLVAKLKSAELTGLSFSKSDSFTG